MAWTDPLVQVFNPNAERSETALRSVLTSLASVVALLERTAQEESPDTDAAKDDRRQLGEQEARFPREAFDDIAGLFGRRLASAGAVRARLEALLGGVDCLAAERPGAPSAASLLGEATAVRDDTSSSCPRGSPTSRAGRTSSRSSSTASRRAWWPWTRSSRRTTASIGGPWRRRSSHASVAAGAGSWSRAAPALEFTRRPRPPARRPRARAACRGPEGTMRLQPGAAIRLARRCDGTT